MDEVHRTDDGHAIGVVELGLEVCRSAGIQQPQSLREAVGMGSEEARVFAEWMVWSGMRWLSHRDLLVGVAWAFMEVHELLSRDGDGAILDEQGLQVLRGIAARERRGLEVCRREIDRDERRKAEFRRGAGIGRAAIQTCFNR